MPIYEYQCADCHHQFDILQKVNDEPIKNCPKCSKDKAIRLISPAGFQLKGSGWYATDFKNKGKAEAKPAESKVDASTKTSEASKRNETSKSNEGKSD